MWGTWNCLVFVETTMFLYYCIIKQETLFLCHRMYGHHNIKYIMHNPLTCRNSLWDQNTFKQWMQKLCLEKYQVYRIQHLYNFHWWWQVVRLITLLFKTFVSLFLVPFFDWMVVYLCYWFDIYILLLSFIIIVCSSIIPIMILELCKK